MLQKANSTRSDQYGAERKNKEGSDATCIHRTCTVNLAFQSQGIHTFAHTLVGCCVIQMLCVQTVVARTQSMGRRARTRLQSRRRTSGWGVKGRKKGDMIQQKEKE